MNNSVLLNSNIFGEMLKTYSIGISKKYQKDTINYYFTPNLCLKMFNVKVTWTDKKNISFCVNKWENTSLLNLMKFIEKGLINLYNKYDSENTDKIVSSFFYEKGDYFYIRCF